MGKHLKIAYLSAKDVYDKRSWSGIHNKMFTALSNHFSDIIFVGPVKSKKLEKSLDLLNRIHFKLFSSRYNKLHNLIRSKFYAVQFEKQLRDRKIDLLFAPAASTEIAFLKTSIPVCYLSDTSFDQLLNYYDTFSNFSGFSLRESKCIEARAVKKSSFQVYSSAWAADYAISNYSLDPNKVYIVPFGANMDNIPEEKNIAKTYTGEIKLLFAAKHWVRKGGDIVLKAFEILRTEGCDISLTILGCKPPLHISDPKVEVIPFLNKNIPVEQAEFLDIFHKSHLLFLPTRADCTPIVFCEANAFGMPVISTDTGGVTSIIENGKNGFALPVDATPLDYAKQIKELMDNREKLKEMSLQARQKYEEDLNWDHWASKMKEIFFENVE